VGFTASVPADFGRDRGQRVNDYDNFTKKAYVPKTKKLMALSKAYLRSPMPPFSLSQTERHYHY
jgi:hypothetical protein